LVVLIEDDRFGELDADFRKEMTKKQALLCK
jgi:hypothetical protein